MKNINYQINFIQLKYSITEGVAFKYGKHNMKQNKKNEKNFYELNCELE